MASDLARFEIRSTLASWASLDIRNLRPKSGPSESTFKGKSLSPAALDAGYNEKNPGQSGWQALQNVQGKVSDILDSLGLTDEVLMKIEDVGGGAGHSDFERAFFVVIVMPLRTKLDDFFAEVNADATAHADDQGLAVKALFEVIHDVSRTTLLTYTHAIPDSQRQAVDRVSGVLFSDVLNSASEQNPSGPVN
jgi:hypothetical protein